MNISENLVTPKGNYHDLHFRIVLALVASHLVISFGEEESFFELLLMSDYYQSMAFSFVIAFILVCLVSFVTVRLDAGYDWKQKTALRLVLQFSLGLLLPAILAFVLAFFYFNLNGYRIFDTLYLKYDFPVIVLMLVLLNVYYLAFYFYRAWRTAEQLALTASQTNATTHPVAETGAKEVFIVQRGAKNIPLPVSIIAYFYREGDYNFLKTFDEESFLVPQTLDEVEAQLDPATFFRANRQMIVQHKACMHFSQLEFGKLELFVSPTAKEPIVISQRRAKYFKEWMER